MVTPLFQSLTFKGPLTCFHSASPVDAITAPFRGSGVPGGWSGQEKRPGMWFPRSFNRTSVRLILGHEGYVLSLAPDRS